MCYAFAERFEENTNLLNLTERNSKDRTVSSLMSTTMSASAEAASRKRRASSASEHQLVKARKLCDDADDSSLSGQSEASGQVIAAGGGRCEPAEELARMKSEVRRLKASVTELSNEREEYLVRSVDAETENEELKTKLKEAKGKNASSGAVQSKRLREEIEQKCALKMKTQQAGHEEKFKNLHGSYQIELNQRRDKHDAKIEELNEKHAKEQKAKDEAQKKKIDDMKAKDLKRDGEWKAFKAEHLKIQKDLKIEKD